MARCTDTAPEIGDASLTSKVGDVALLAEASAVPVRATRARFLLLISAACFMFGNYYFFDQTSATEKAIKNKTGMSETTFGFLSSVYSWPNVILPLFGGLFIDRMGVRTAAVFFTTLVLLGSMLFTFGLYIGSTATVITARTLFGMGGESQNVAALALVSKWFVGKELAFSMGFLIAVSRLGSVATLDSQSALAGSVGVAPASAVGSVVCFCSLLAAFAAAGLDWRADSKDAAKGLSVVSAEVDEAVRLTDFRKLSPVYWLVSISCVAVYVAAFPFMQVISAPYLQERFGFDSTTAGNILANVNLTSAFLSPVLGLIVDRFGRRPQLLVLSTLIFIACHTSLLLFPECHHCWSVVGVYVCMGMALSVYGAVVWPCVPLIVEPEVVGTAFGIMTALQNLGMAVSPMVLTELHSATGSFTLPYLYIIGCCTFGLAAAVGVWISDRRHGSILYKGAQS